MALKEVARNVTGVDASAEMIALAPRADGIRYVVTPAENLPFEEGEFDLITLSQVFHWLDRDRFLTEAYRVLRPGGWLIAYDNYFTGRVMGNLDIHGWYKEYIAKYPAPPRGEITFTVENTNRYGFRLLKEERYENTIIFSIKTLVDYLATHSNVIAAVEGGKEEIGQAKSWLAEITQPAFRSAEEAGFLFDAPVWYLQRST